MKQWAVRDYFNDAGTNTWGDVRVYDGTAPKWYDYRGNVVTNNSRWNKNAGPNYGSLSLPISTYNGGYVSRAMSSNNFELLMKVVIPSSAQTVMAVGANVMHASSGAGYEITWSSWNSQLRIRHWSSLVNFGGTVTQLATVTVNPTRGVYYWLSVDCSGGYVRAKMWEAGNVAEPYQPQVSAPYSGSHIPNYGGVMGYAEHSTVQTMRVAQFQMRNYTGANETTATSVVDSFSKYSRFTLGTTDTNHEWHGDHQMSPTFYQGNRSSGNPVTLTYSGDSGIRAHIDRGVAVNREDASYVDVSYTNGSVYAIFMFAGTIGRFSLFMRHAPFGSGGTNTLFGALRVLVFASTSFAVYHHDNPVVYVPHGLTIAANVEYKMRMQIRNNIGYAKLWTGNTEPAEWSKLGPLKTGVNAAGRSGFWTQNHSSYGQKHYIYHYESSTTTWVNKLTGDATNRAIKFTINSPTPRVRRKVTATPRSIGSSLIAYPLRVKSDTSAAQFTNSITSSAVMRFNLEGSMWIDGVWTKVNYAPDLQTKIISTNQPLRVRKTAVTNAIALGAVLNGKRIRKSTSNRSAKFTLDFAAQVIPDNEANLDSKYGFSFYSVISKGGETSLNTKFGLSAGSVLGLTDKSDARIFTILDAQIPGFFVVRAFGNISSSMEESTPLVRYTDTSDAVFTPTLMAEGYVQTIHFGSLDAVASFGASYETSLSAVGQMNSYITSEMEAKGVRSYLNTFDAHLSTGYVLDRPNFDVDYKELIERRTSFIHYACTYHNREELVIEYRHKKTMDRSSVTYFIAYNEENQEPLLYGASINMWEDDMIIIHMSDNVGDDLVQMVREEFALEVDKVPKEPRFHQRPSALLVAPRIAEKPFHQRAYHQYVDAAEEIPENAVPIESDIVITPENKTEIIEEGAVRIEDKED